MKPALLIALLALAAPAAADETPPAAAAAQPAAAAAQPTRVRATHRVDVIAPGERVETVIDRLRAARPAASGAADARPPSDRPVRPPDGQAPGSRPPDRQGARPGHDGPATGGPAPPTPPPTGEHGGSHNERTRR